MPRDFGVFPAEDRKPWRTLCVSPASNSNSVANTLKNRTE
jgi:hypothetical protein